MAQLSAQRIAETSTTTGTGDIYLGGASPSSMSTFSSAFSDGALVSYVILNKAVLTEWEAGIGTYHATPNTISRTHIRSGSNGTSSVNFSAGSKSVLNAPPSASQGAPFDSNYVYVPGDTMTSGGSTYLSLTVNVGTTPSTDTTDWIQVGGGGGGAVSSVFERTGAVVASPGDYATYYGGLATANTWTQTNTFDLSLSIANGYGLTAPGGAALVTGPGGGTFGITAGSGGADTLHLGPTPGGNGAYWIIDTNLNATISSIQSGASTVSSPNLTLQGWNGSASVGMQFTQGYANFFIQPTGAGASGSIMISPSSNLNLITTQSGAASNSPLLVFYGWSGSAAETNYIYGSSTGALSTKNNILDNGSGGATFTGTVTAPLFSGSGTSLTGVGLLGSVNTWTSSNIFNNGYVQVGNSTLAGNAVLYLDAAAAQYKELAFQTASTNRWIVYADNSAETGSNAGSNFNISAYSDTGAGLYNVLFSTRSTGALYSKNNTLDNGSGGAAFTGAISSASTISSTGSGAALYFHDRSGTQNWGWYGNGSVAYLYNGSSNVLSIDPSGDMILDGTLGVTNSITLNSSGVSQQSTYQSPSFSVPASTAAWYRIAYFGSLVYGSAGGGGRASAQFTITDTSDGQHSETTFKVSNCFGTNAAANNPSLQILGRSYYGGHGMMQAVRVLTGSVYDGCAIEVYLNNTNASAKLVWFNMSDNCGSNSSADGFVPVNFTAGSVPASFTTTEWNFAASVGESSDGEAGIISVYPGQTNVGVCLMNPNYFGALNITTPTGYMSLGSQNGEYNHIIGNLTFYFNQTLQVNGNIGIYGTAFGLTTGGVFTAAQGHFVNGSSEADIYFGPNSSYLFSDSGHDLGVYNPTYGTLFDVTSQTGNGYFKGTISASNFSGSSSGTNTGDQNLAPYALLSGATFTGLVTNTGSYIREYYGASGNYSTVGTSAWGGPIWGMDTGYTGGVGAANWSPSGVYGIAWQRATSTNANANIGEGLYVYQNGVLEGGIGTSGIYSAHTIIAGGAISGSNLSGTNTGDQNLSGYALLSGATFTGTIFAPTFQISSSVVLKQDITPLEDTSILDKMNFYSYRLKANPDKLHFGLIAEELAEISSDLVGYDKDGKPFSINMLELIPLLAKRIETLTKEVAVLRAAK